MIEAGVEDSEEGKLVGSTPLLAPPYPALQLAKRIKISAAQKSFLLFILLLLLLLLLLLVVVHAELISSSHSFVQLSTASSFRCCNKRSAHSSSAPLDEMGVFVLLLPSPRTVALLLLLRRTRVVLLLPTIPLLLLLRFIVGAAFIFRPIFGIEKTSKE
jgi:hypothetical protein